METQSKLPEFPTISEQWKKVSGTQWDEANSLAAYEKQKSLWNEQSKKAKAAGKEPPRAPTKPANPRLNQNYPANLFNGMINPVIPYAIRGAIWYQGENNAHRDISRFYGLQLRTLIHDWRTRWGYDFPFAWVQLPDFKEPQKEAVESTGWTTVREEMLKTLKVPRTGMAVTLGLGEAKDIHPRNKQDVGKRLAMWALAEVYKKKGIASSGPLPGGIKIKGDKVIVSFKHTEGGLTGKGDALKGFAIAGADHKWMRAQAKIDGDKVVVFHPDLKQPTAVRYAWADNPEFSLYNGAGLPATPFRTDDWKE
jgi:sialate O-acetylesterase